MREKYPSKQALTVTDNVTSHKNSRSNSTAGMLYSSAKTANMGIIKIVIVLLSVNVFD